MFFLLLYTILVHLIYVISEGQSVDQNICNFVAKKKEKEGLLHEQKELDVIVVDGREKRSPSLTDEKPPDDWYA